MLFGYVPSHSYKKILSKFWLKNLFVTGHTINGLNVESVTGHTPGRIDRNGTVFVEGSTVRCRKVNRPLVQRGLSSLFAATRRHHCTLHPRHSSHDAFTRYTMPPPRWAFVRYVFSQRPSPFVGLSNFSRAASQGSFQLLGFTAHLDLDQDPLFQTKDPFGVLPSLLCTYSLYHLTFCIPFPCLFHIST